jgi:hypothetical protein
MRRLAAVLLVVVVLVSWTRALLAYHDLRAAIWADLRTRGGASCEW